MKNRKWFIVNLMLTLFMMFIIFMLSAENGDNSTMTSGRFINSDLGQFILSVIKLIFNPKDPINFIREMAHLFEFFMLSIFSYNVILYSKDRKTKYVVILNILFGVLYSISDEIHQIFVPDRAFQVFDIMVDSIGILLGTALMLGIHKLLDNRY